jgi:hypothetical protein
MKFNRHVLSKLAIAVCLIGLGAFWRTAAQRSPSPQQTSAKSLLSLADFYNKSNDTSDAADRYYRQVIAKYPGTREAGLAQFNRGAYWHRKFNILRRKRGDNDRTAQSALVEAEGQYYDFIDKYAAKTNTLDLFSDGEFNLALVYFQKNKRDTGIGWLNVLISRAEKYDKQVYISRIVWSSDSADVIDRSFNASELARAAGDIFSRKDLSNDQVISQLKQWCRSH